MRGRRLAIGLLALTGLAPATARAQVSAADLLDVQLGNAPARAPSDLIGVYDRADLAVFMEGLRAGIRFQLDHNSENLYPYARVTQRWLELSGERGRVRVGNTYTILGRGLLQRSFELPGVVLTHEGTPSRFGFSRDVDGMLVEGRAGPIALRALSGQPTAGDISPGVADAIPLALHAGDLSGGQLSAGPWRGTSVGAATMRLSPLGGAARELASGFAEMDPLALAGVRGAALPLYLEYALDQPSWRDWWRFHDGSDRTHGLYASTGLLWGPLGFSAEWKDYHRMLLGVNDPPSLVREQSWFLLNRTTHVLRPNDERGHQLEGTWRQPGLGDLTLNLSHGDGRLVPRLPRRNFDERFAELHLAPARWNALDVSGFADGGRDEFEGVSRRETYGGSARLPLPAGFSCEGDFEHQSTRQLGVSSVDHEASFVLHRAGWGSAGLTWQRSTNPLDAKPGADPVHPPARYWWGGTVSATLAERFEASLFAGQRRKGLACTAGTCYTVEALEGIAFRLVSRF